MNRREILRLFGSAGVAGVLPGPGPTFGQAMPRYTVSGAGPTVIGFDRAPKGYFDRLADQYRVIAMEYPPRDDSQAFVDSFTADRVCSDILAVADAEHTLRFA